MSIAKNVQPITVNPSVAARMLGVSPAQIYKMMRRGDLTGRKCGGRTLIRVSDIHACVEALPVFESAMDA